jgi:putative tricarboxylic transport membrane protein
MTQQGHRELAMDGDSKRKPGEVVFALLMLLISLVLFWQAYRISGFQSKSSPGSFPLAVTGVMVVSALVALTKTLKSPAGDSSLAALRTEIIPNVVLGFGALVLGYGLFLESLGFILSSFAFLFGGILLLYQRGIRPAFVWALVSIAGVYVTFRLIFKVILPEGIVPERRILAEIGSFLSKVLGQ